VPFPILGLHHVTATVDEAQPDLDFSVGTLGLRLVKKTVNFDNHHVYHFYYGDERGTPGTIWTTFPYHGRGVRTGVKGAGQVTRTSFSVPAGSLDRWEARLRARGVAASRIRRFDEDTLQCSDSSGLHFELVGTERDRRDPWTGSGLDAGMAIRGLHSVTMVVRDVEPTVALMREMLGFEVAGEQGDRTRVAVNGSEPGKWIDIVRAPDADAAINGIGTVHHVAMAIDRPDDQVRLREELLARGLKVTAVRDRCYFQSIYFREPGGVLFEVATTSPGFAADEDVSALGEGLRLPPWEEEHRADIEEHLVPVLVPGRSPSPTPP
jgi:glyoxalase family protein